MTILGLFALFYYTVLLASGVVGTDVMPQFVITAVIFLSSGRILGQAARRNRAPKERQGKKPSEEPDWAHLTDVLRWVMAFLIMGALGLWVLKPVGVSFFEMFVFKWAG